MHYELFLTNIFFTLSILFTVGIGVHVLTNSQRRDLAWTFVLLTSSMALLQISHVIGINIDDADTSRSVFMSSLVNVPLVVFTAHFILALMGRVRRERYLLWLFYVSGASLVAFYLVFPEHFLLPSVPKLYFPNYYEPGTYYWVMRLYIFVVSAYFTYHALREYFVTDDGVMKNRLRYIIAGLMIFYLTSSAMAFLIFDVKIDPIFASVMSISIMPLAYAAVRYNLVDINVVARRAIVYALLVTILTSIVSIASFSTLFIADVLPDFPFWLMPVMSSVVAASVGYLVWRKMKEDEVLKYEFVTVITHKFRTPLTHIRWATELLLSAETDETKRHEIQNIRESNLKLIDLTNTLIAVADTDRTQNTVYKFEEFCLGDMVAEVAETLKSRMEDRKIAFSLERWDNGARIKGDRERVKFVAQTLIENAISYSPIGGTVVAAIESDKKNAIIRVKDAGIGISKEELANLFSKFFRSSRAKVADTEGVGVGLFLVKSIMDRHSGSIEADSAGVNKGTTFLVTFPKVS